MDELQESQLIANALAEVWWWFHQSPGFFEYVEKCFGCTVRKPVKFNGIYIFEAEEGDATEGAIGGLIKNVWLVDDRGLIAAPAVKLPRYPDAIENLRDQFYITPVIKFFRQGEKITIGEAFGPEMRCRKIAQVVFQHKGASILETRVIWTSRSICEAARASGISGQS